MRESTTPIDDTCDEVIAEFGCKNPAPGEREMVDLIKIAATMLRARHDIRLAPSVIRSVITRKLGERKERR